MTGPARALRVLLLGLVLVAASASAAPMAPSAPGNDAAPLQVQDAVEARRFRALVSELRCVMCQNQSLADSDALIAHELRAEVLGLMRQGLDDDAIKAHLVARYGEFVLYRPRVEPATWPLWFGPGVLVLLGGFVVFRLARKGDSGRVDVPRDEEQEW